MERLYLDEATSELLYTKDKNPVTCDSKELAFDEMGTLHLLYYSDKHKILRDFIIPSDPEPGETVSAVKDRMQDRLEKGKATRRVQVFAWTLCSITIIVFTLSILYMLVS